MVRRVWMNWRSLCDKAVAQCSRRTLRGPLAVTIREMAADDVADLFVAFAGWKKPLSRYSSYFAEQRCGTRAVLVARHRGKVVGYCTVLWQSRYAPHRQAGVPEIADLNVLTACQRRGVGTALIRAAEKAACRQSREGIGVGADRAAGASGPVRLYRGLGYRPDGVDDARDVLYLSKALKDAVLAHMEGANQ